MLADQWYNGQRQMTSQFMYWSPDVCLHRLRFLLSVSPIAYLSIRQPAYLTTRLRNEPLACLFTYLFAWLLVYLAARISVYTPVYTCLPACLSAYLYIYPPLYLPACLPARWLSTSQLQFHFIDLGGSGTSPDKLMITRSCPSRDFDRLEPSYPYRRSPYMGRF